MKYTVGFIFLSCASFPIDWFYIFSSIKHWVLGSMQLSVSVLSAYVLLLLRMYCRSRHPKDERKDAVIQIHVGCLTNSCGLSLNTSRCLFCKASSMPLCCQIIKYLIVCGSSFSLLRAGNCVVHWSNNSLLSFPWNHSATTREKLCVTLSDWTHLPECG